MRKRLILLVVVLTAATRLFAQSADTVAMPYLADFTQGWTATGGAVIVDNNHAVLSGVEQQLVSPWIRVADDYQGCYIMAHFRQEGTYAQDDAVHLHFEYVDGYSEDYTYWLSDIDSGWNDGHVWIPQGVMRVTLTYEGSAGSQLHVSDFAAFKYVIQHELKAEAYMVHVGDTLTVRSHVVMPDGSAPDSVVWNIFSVGYRLYEDAFCTIIEQNDTLMRVVMNDKGRMGISHTVYKHNLPGGHYASDYTSMIVVGTDQPFYEEDSIYYTSAAKDTVIGSHYYLQDAVLPEGVKAVMDSAFVMRHFLLSASLPQSLEYIGKGAFANNFLYFLTIPENVTYIGDNAFDGVASGTVYFNARNCSYMGSSDAESAFFWSSLRRIVFGEEVRRIPDYAFTYCYGMGDSLIIPDQVEYIGDHAFISDSYNYGGQLSIVIGRSVNHIGDQAFYCPDHIASVAMRNPVAPAVDGAPFPLLDCPLVVPCGAYEAYHSAPYWREWGEIEEDCNAIGDVEEEACATIYVHNGQIVVATDGTTQRPEVCIYSVDGRLVARGYGSRYNVPAPGAYIVRAGTLPPRRVVVMK